MKTPRILVVDDNPTNLRLAVDLLEFEGYEVFKAADAKQAQKIISESSLDLILMDIGLPGMDGLTLTRLIKAAPETSHIPIVALTAFAMKKDHEEATNAGCDGYITKPIDTRRFTGQVAEFLGRPKLELPGKMMNILVIEDQESELKLIHHVLSAEGHNVSGAEAAQQAFAAIAENQPSIILLDLSLPGLDGLALARRLKSDIGTKDIHIVAMTTYPEKFSKADAIAAGCDAFLVKPLSTRTLSQDLLDVLSRDC